MFSLLMLALDWIPEVIAGASVITAITPTPKDDRILGKAYKVLEVFGLVVGKAKDKAPRAKKSK